MHAIEKRERKGEENEHLAGVARQPDGIGGEESAQMKMTPMRP